MNKRQKLQVSLAAFFVVYIIVLLFFPGWGASKILGIISGVLILMALYFPIEQRKRIKKIATSKFQFFLDNDSGLWLACEEAAKNTVTEP